MKKTLLLRRLLIRIKTRRVFRLLPLNRRAVVPAAGIPLPFPWRRMAVATLLGLLLSPSARAEGPLRIPVPKGTNVTYTSEEPLSYNFALVVNGRRAGVSLVQTDAFESYAALAKLYNEGLATEEGIKPAISVHPEKLEGNAIRGEALLLPDKEGCLVHFSFKAGRQAWKGTFAGAREQWDAVRDLLRRIEPND